MLKVFAVALVVACIGLAAFVLPQVKSLAARRSGRLVLLLAAFVFPAGALLGTLAHGVKASSSTTFCMECHEMSPYGQSLFVDDPQALPAVHYQNRLIDRDQTCFACHTNYAMFGDVKAKMDGLLHVWVHYVGPMPDKFELYQPYPNRNCLHCHEDGRSFLESPAHAEDLAAMRSDKRSCLECHDLGHALDQVEQANFWQATP